MKKTSIKKNRLYLGLMAGTAITFAALGFSPKAVKSDYARSGVEYSGESIFKGIFFGEKKVGQFIPDIAEERIYKGNAQGMGAFLRKIESADANFFISFKHAMESGDPLQVEKALTDANKVLAKVLQVKGKAENNGVEGTFVYIIGETASTDITWVPGPFNNLATSVSTEGKPGLALDREKAISYLASNLQK